MTGQTSSAPRRVLSISSRDNALIQLIRKLSQDATAYRKLGQVWLEGDHLGLAARERGRCLGRAVIAESVWLGEHGRAQTADPHAIHLTQLACRADEVVVVPDALWRHFSGLDTPARIGFLTSLVSIQSDHSGASSGVRPGVPTVVLDRVQDAGNVGSILRTAAAMGVRQVLALKGTAALWSAKVLRAGMGAHFGLHLVEQALPDDLVALQLACVATSLQTPHTLTSLTLPTPCAWVFGHEGQGVAPEVLARCEWQVRIPQPGGEESLNVAAAAAICLYESMRQGAHGRP